MAGGEDDIKTTWTADFSSLSDSFKEAQEGATEAFGTIENAAEEGAKNTHGHTEEMSEGFEGVGETIKNLHSTISEAMEFVGISAAIEGFHMLGEAIEGAAQHGVQIINMSTMLQVTGAQFQALEEAADATGVGIQTVQRAGMRLVAMLEQARQGSGSAQEKLESLGISLSDINDKSFTAGDALQVLHERLEDANTSTQTMTALTAALGARSALAAQAIKEYDGSQEGTQKVMDAVNGTTDEQNKKLQELNAAYEQLKTRAQNTWEKIVLGAVSATSAIGDYLQKVGEAEAAASDTPQNQLAIAKEDPNTEARMEGMEAIQKATEQQMEEQSRANAQELIGVKQVTQEQIDAAKVVMDLDRSGTLQKMQDAEEYSKLVSEKYSSNTSQAKSAAQEAASAAKQYYDQQASNAAKESSDELAIARTKIASLSAIYKASQTEYDSTAKQQLTALTSSLTEQDGAVQASITQQRSMNSDLYATKQISASQAYAQSIALDSQEVASKIAMLEQEKAAYAQNFDFQKEQAQANAQQQQASALEVLSATVSSINEQKAAYSDNQQKQIELDSELAKASATYDAQILESKQNLETQLASIEGQSSAKSQELSAAEVKAQQQYDAQILKDRQQLGQRITQEWQQVTSALSSGLASSLSGMLEGTMTFGDAMRNIFTSVLDALIQKFADWAIQNVAQILIGKAATQAAAVSQISANAGVAATAAMASVAAIPYYGWAMAPEVGAQTAAEALGFESLASAAGGWDNIPHDQLAAVHKNEMILPSKFSDGLRNMIGSFQSGNNSNGAGGANTKGFSLNVSNADSDNFLVRKDDVAGLMQQLNNRFAFNNGRR